MQTKKKKTQHTISIKCQKTGLNLALEIGHKLIQIRTQEAKATKDQVLHKIAKFCI